MNLLNAKKKCAIALMTTSLTLCVSPFTFAQNNGQTFVSPLATLEANNVTLENVAKEKASILMFITK